MLLYLVLRERETILMKSFIMLKFSLLRIRVYTIIHCCNFATFKQNKE